MARQAGMRMPPYDFYWTTREAILRGILKNVWNLARIETLRFLLPENLGAQLYDRNTRRWKASQLNWFRLLLIKIYLNGKTLSACRKALEILRICQFRHKRFSSFLRLKEDLFAGVNDKERPTRIEWFLFIARTFIPLLWQTSLKLGSSSCKTEQPSRFALTSANMGHWSENFLGLCVC